MDAIAVWFSGLTKSGKTTAVLVYVMVFMMAGTVIATEHQQNQLANAPVETAVASPYSQETLAAVSEQKRIMMVFAEDVPFKKKEVKDTTLPKGQSYIQTAGVNGARDVTYEITYVDGKETDRTVLKEKILKKPVTQVKVVGTYEAPIKPESEAQTLGVNEEKSDEEDSTKDRNEEIEYYKVWVWNRQNKTSDTFCPASDETEEYQYFNKKGPFQTKDKCYESSNNPW
jgi:hypothetical protein